MMELGLGRVAPGHAHILLIFNELSFLGLLFQQKG